MTAPKGSKDVILVNCQEVPETICVETRFITQSGKQKNPEKIIFTTNIGSLELNKDDQNLSAKIVQPVSKTPNITVSIKPNLGNVRAPPINQVVNFPQFHLSQQAQHASPLANLNNNSSLSAGQNVLIPSVATQLNSSSQDTSLKFNTPIVPVTQLRTVCAPNNLDKARCLNEQIQQTDISAFNRHSIGIQCQLDDELDDLDIEWPVVSENSCENNENDKENFMQFVKDNSTHHKNYKECLICGELCKSNKYFYGHMAVHRGPKVLCFKCGECLEHKNLLPQHRCQKARQLAKAFLKCPHFFCKVNAVSLLELYDHINEHTNSRIYKCSACEKGFCTGQEFLRHILIRAKCFTGAKRKRFRVYGLESQQDRKCRVRVFTLHTYKKCTALVKTYLTKRDRKKRIR